MSLRDELRDPWGILVGGIAGGLGWAVGIPVAAAAGIGAAVWVVKGIAGAVTRGGGASLPAAGAFDPEHVRDELRRLRGRIKGKVPGDILARFDGIAKTIESILPRTSALGAGSEDLFVLQRTATDYLPTALEAYTRLPQDYATEHVIIEGKTSRDILAEQLDLMHAQIREIAIAVNKNDSDKLLAHGRFLEERFGRGDLSIGDGPT